VDVAGGLRTAGRGAIYGGAGHIHRALIASEISLAVILLSGASLLMRSVLKMSAAPLGFDPAHLSIMSTTLPEQRYKNAADKLSYYDDLARKLNAIPGVEGAAMATAMPPYGAGNYEVQIEGKDRGGLQDVSQNLIGPDYFRVLRIALRRGRVFDARDRQGSTPVAIVNETFVREYLADMDPIGKRVRTFGFETGPWATIVGVAATEKHPEFMHEMEWQEQAGLYRPLAQDPPGYISIAVRTRGDRQDIGHALETAVTSLDADVPAGGMQTMHARLGAFLTYPRFRAVVTDGFAALALLLAMIGLHGLLSQYVAQRTRELGLRMAIGAQVRDILRLIARQAGIPVLAGIGAGLVLTLALSRYMASLLFEIAPTDPVTMVAAPLALAVVSILAVIRPALNAARIDPVTALREE
jgi:predicted permease